MMLANPLPALSQTPDTWASFTTLDRPKVDLVKIGTELSAADRKVDLSLNLTWVAPFEAAEFTRALIDAFEDVRIPVNTDQAPLAAIEGYCNQVNETYRSELDARVRKGAMRLRPFEAVAGTGSTVAVSSLTAPVVTGGWLEIPLCVPALQKPTVALAVVPEKGTLSEMFLDLSVARKTMIKTTFAGDIETIRASSGESVTSSGRDWSKQLTDVHWAVTSNLLNTTTLAVEDPKGPIRPHKDLLLIAPQSFPAVVRYGISSEAAAPAQIARVTKSIGDDFALPLGNVEEAADCPSTVPSIYGHDTEIRDALTFNAKYRANAPNAAKMLVADTGVIDAETFRDSQGVYVRSHIKGRTFADRNLIEYEHGSMVMSLAMGGWLADDTRNIYLANFQVTPVNIFTGIGDQRVASSSSLAAILADLPSVNVVNLSVTYTNKGDAEIISKDEHKGKLFIVAAGNRGKNLRNAPTYPAYFGNASNVITVAGLDGSLLASARFSDHAGKWILSDDDTTTYKSDRLSYDTMVSIAAPACRVQAWAQQWPADGRALMSQKSATGTSFAAPMVSFAAALIVREGVDQPAKIKNRILATADRVSSIGGVDLGRRLNIERAVSVAFDRVTTIDGQVIAGRAEFRQIGNQEIGANELVSFCDFDGTLNIPRVAPASVARLTREYFKKGRSAPEMSPGPTVWSIDQGDLISSPECAAPSQTLSVLIRQKRTDGSWPARDDPANRLVPLVDIRDITFATDPEWLGRP